jgi:hypothetical protein
MVTFDRNCPNCRWPNIHKSCFQMAELIASLALLRPVRCGHCKQRFFRPLFYYALQCLHPAHSSVRGNASATSQGPHGATAQATSA